MDRVPGGGKICDAFQFICVFLFFHIYSEFFCGCEHFAPPPGKVYISITSTHRHHSCLPVRCPQRDQRDHFVREYAAWEGAGETLWIVKPARMNKAIGIRVMQVCRRFWAKGIALHGTMIWERDSSGMYRNPRDFMGGGVDPPPPRSWWTNPPPHQAFPFFRGCRFFCQQFLSAQDIFCMGAVVCGGGVNPPHQAFPYPGKLPPKNQGRPFLRGTPFAHRPLCCSSRPPSPIPGGG